MFQRLLLWRKTRNFSNLQTFQKTSKKITTGDNFVESSETDGPGWIPRSCRVDATGSFLCHEIFKYQFFDVFLSDIMDHGTLVLMLYTDRAWNGLWLLYCCYRYIYDVFKYDLNLTIVRNAGCVIKCRDSEHKPLRHYCFHHNVSIRLIRLFIGVAVSFITQWVSDNVLLNDHQRLTNFVFSSWRTSKCFNKCIEIDST